MHQHSSSILSFKSGLGNTIRKTIVTGLWIIFFLLIFDFGINFLFPYPSNPLVTSPGQINKYFEYGRSLEGKLSRMIGNTDQSTAPIAISGWLDPELWKKSNLPVNHNPDQDLLIAIYGMSFSNHVGKAMEEIDSKLMVRLVAGPTAPPNHSFAAYNLDRGRHQADVVILGILAQNIQGMGTLMRMTWQFEEPAPYTYPRYFLEDGKLKAIQPNIQSLAQLRVAFQNPQQWNAFVNQLEEHDQFFDGFIFKRNWLDNSAILRLIRRASAQHHDRTIKNQIYNSATGFNPGLEIPALKSIVKDFASTAKADGKMPIVLLFNNRGYQDHLFQALKPTLEKDTIPYISTHNIVPATDITNFVSDGHFTPAADKLIAKAVIKLINENFDRGNRTLSPS